MKTEPKTDDPPAEDQPTTEELLLKALEKLDRLEEEFRRNIPPQEQPLRTISEKCDFIRRHGVDSYLARQGLRP